MPSPTVSRPPDTPGGPIVLQADLTQMPHYGYVQDEFLFGGTARAYNPVGPIGTDGQWSVAKASSAPYKTRMLVRRPSNPAKFNGTVVVEWLNVTAGFDTSPDWQYARVELMRQGYIWVGISAQTVGVQGGLLALKSIDPTRYGALNHPGDDYSYDMFSQAARALVGTEGREPARRLHAALPDRGRRVAVGVAHDHVRGRDQPARPRVRRVPDPQPLGRCARDQLDLDGRDAEPDPHPHRHLDTGDGGGGRDRTSRGTRPPGSPTPRTSGAGRSPGTAHADLYMLGPDSAGVLGCTLPPNAGPHHFVIHTALRDLRTWMRSPWKLPPSSPKIQLDATGNVARDVFGNALGGIRSPELDVPAATLSGFGNSPGLCSLFGTTTKFTPTRLAGIYGDRTTYILYYLNLENAAFASKFFLPEDGWVILADAANVQF